MFTIQQSSTRKYAFFSHKSVVLGIYNSLWEDVRKGKVHCDLQEYREALQNRIWGGPLRCAFELYGNGEREHSENQWHRSKGVGGSGEHRALALLN